MPQKKNPDMAELVRGKTGRVYGDLVANIVDEKLDELSQLYYLAAYADRTDVVKSFNDYYRTFGAEDKDLILTDEEKAAAEAQSAPTGEPTQGDAAQTTENENK